MCEMSCGSERGGTGSHTQHESDAAGHPSNKQLESHDGRSCEEPPGKYRTQTTHGGIVKLRGSWARFFRKLLKGQGRVPRRLFTNKLRSYSAAHRTLMPSVIQLNDDASRAIGGSSRPLLVNLTATNSCTNAHQHPHTLACTSYGRGSITTRARLRGSACSSSSPTGIPPTEST